MNTWIIFFRGINVGGRNVVKMKELANALEAAGLQDVRTYIQSGNVVCRSRHRSAKPVEALVRKAVQSEFSMEPDAVVLTAAEVDEALTACPFETSEEKTVHFFFLREAASVEATDVDAVAVESESWHLSDRVFYLHAPDGIGRSKLAAGAEKLLRVSATARNLRTVRQLVEMCEG